MYWFDLMQQFGIVVPLIAVAGGIQMTMTNRRRAALLALMFAANVAFAFSYNVGDSHVFYLPSHLIVALLIAPGLVLSGRITPVLPTLAAVAADALRRRAWLPRLPRA